MAFEDKHSATMGNGNLQVKEINPASSASSAEGQASSTLHRNGRLSDRIRERRSHPVPVSVVGQQRENANIIKRDGFRVQPEKESIIEAATNHNCYVIGKTTLRALPIYDDCGPYGLKSNNFNILLDKEVDKLIALVTNENPPLFDSEGALRGTSRKDFEDLSGLADQLSCNLSILTHDNSRHGIEIPTIASEAWDCLIASRRRLRKRYAQDQSRVEGWQPAVLSDPELNRKAYHKLLDYILALVAWWVVRCADNKYWKIQMLAILAQFAVKMKIVARNPVECAATTLAETYATIQRMKNESEFNERLIKIGGKDREVDVLSTDTDLSNLYYEEKMLLRQHLENIIHGVLESLTRHERSGNEADSFEMCTMIYRTGLEGVTSMLTGQRHGNIVASSNLQRINFAYSAFKLLEKNTLLLKKMPTPSPTSSSADSLKVRWGANASADQGSEIAVCKMDHVISLLVPMSLVEPGISQEIAFLINLTNVLADEGDPIRQFEPPPRDFALEYTISTRPWLSKTDGSTRDRIFDPDIQQLSQSPLRRGIQNSFVSRSSIPESFNNNKISKIIHEYGLEAEKMSKWIITASSITVRCRTYVTLIQGVTALIVLGGLAVPFTVGSRISGVDPFQIALFAWLVGGFLLAAAKSRYVNSWPWHDFLRGCVVCRSLSNLSDVSGVKPQIVLLYLLHNEWNSLLITESPYNGMFTRRSDPREKSNSKDKNNQVVHRVRFSIDVPVDNITMLASGFVLLKVLNAEGEHLICIDGRKGGWDAARQGRRGNWMTCPNFNRDALENVQGSGVKDRDIKRRIHMLERREFRWNKVLGVYTNESRFG